MKKVISIALFAVIFGLIGCSAQKYQDRTAERDYAISSAGDRAKCKTCPYAGKLGMEQRAGDTAK